MNASNIGYEMIGNIGYEMKGKMNNENIVYDDSNIGDELSVLVVCVDGTNREIFKIKPKTNLGNLFELYTKKTGYLYDFYYACEQIYFSDTLESLKYDDNIPILAKSIESCPISIIRIVFEDNETMFTECSYKLMSYIMDAYNKKMNNQFNFYYQDRIISSHCTPYSLRYKDGERIVAKRVQRV